MVQVPKHQVGALPRLDGAGLWDAETVDIRLGQRVAEGAEEIDFSAIDLQGLKVYRFHAEVEERTTCGGEPCTRVELRLAGMLRYVGPVWDYWYGEDGQLLRFHAAVGRFSASGVRLAADGAQ